KIIDESHKRMSSIVSIRILTEVSEWRPLFLLSKYISKDLNGLLQHLRYEKWLEKTIEILTRFVGQVGGGEVLKRISFILWNDPSTPFNKRISWIQAIYTLFFDRRRCIPKQIVYMRDHCNNASHFIEERMK